VWGAFPDCITGTCTIAMMHASRAAGNGTVAPDTD
jgi:hypothetical protein